MEKNTRPTINLLISECEIGNITKILNPDNTIEYAGFLPISSFVTSHFQKMGTNRIVNKKRVQYIIDKNLRKFKNEKKIHKFETITMIVRNDLEEQKKTPCFYICDGQHRISAAISLANEDLLSNYQIYIPFHVHVVNSEIESNEIMNIIQDVLPSDKRLFSSNENERNRLEEIIEEFRIIWPESFKSFDARICDEQGFETKNYRKEPERPHLSDGIVSDISKMFNMFYHNLSLRKTLLKFNAIIQKSSLENKEFAKIFKSNKCQFGYIRKDINQSIIEDIKNRFDECLNM